MNKNIEIKVEFDEEDDGRVLCDLPQYPGVMAYGVHRNEALCNALTILIKTLKAIEEIEAG